MNRTDISSVMYKKHVDDIPMHRADLVQIDERFLVVFEWAENMLENYIVPKLTREVPKESLIEIQEPNPLPAKYYCTIPMSFGETLEYAEDFDAPDDPEEIPPEWRFEIPTEMQGDA